MRIASRPASAVAGWPLKLALALSKASQDGSGAPPARLALRCSVSPGSTSVNSAGGKAKWNGAVVEAAWLAMLPASVGASSTFATVSVNSSLTCAPEPSVAVTRTLIAPTSTFAGVPLKVWVLVSNVSQVGSVPPEASVAP